MSQTIQFEAAVRRLHAHYIDAVWRKDVAAFGACFTAEALWLIGGQAVQGRAAIEATIAGIFARTDRVFMEFAAPLVEPLGESHVTARTYVTERVRRQDGRANVNLGRYYEHVVEDEGRWRFDWRLFQLFYTGPADLSGDWHKEPDFGPPPGMPPRDYRP